LLRTRTQRHRPHHRQLALGLQAGHLLRVQREVVAEHARGLARGDLAHRGDVVEDRRNIVEQRKQAGTGHLSGLPAAAGLQRYGDRNSAWFGLLWCWRIGKAPRAAAGTASGAAIAPYCHSRSRFQHGGHVGFCLIFLRHLDL
jgi:hypothetical protein